MFADPRPRMYFLFSLGGSPTHAEREEVEVLLMVNNENETEE